MLEDCQDDRPRILAREIKYLLACAKQSPKSFTKINLTVVEKAIKKDGSAEHLLHDDCSRDPVQTSSIEAQKAHSCPAHTGHHGSAWRTAEESAPAHRSGSWGSPHQCTLDLCWSQRV